MFDLHALPNAIGGPSPWTKDMVCMQDAHHFKYVFQLIKGFSRAKYRNTPVVPPSPLINIDDFALKINTPPYRFAPIKYT